MSRSVANPDPESGAFLTLDPGSQTYIFKSLMTNVWVKSTGTIILSVLTKKNFFTCSKIKLFTISLYLWQQKWLDNKKFSPSSFGAVV